jgi:hypothetical protein
MKTDFKNYNPSIHDLISLRQASKKYGLSPNHLRLLVGKGTIWGKKIDTLWVTTNIAIEEYISQEHKTGPKPKST